MNLVKRLGTASIFIPLVFVSIQYFSRFMFFCFIQIVMLAALIEFYNLLQKKKLYPCKTIGVIYALFISVSFYLEVVSIEMALFCGLLMICLYYLFYIKSLEQLVDFPSSIALTFFGICYLSFTMNHFALLREEYGARYIYFLLAVVFIGDTGAFFFGRIWGKRKFFPMASPKKTWEGSIGSLILSSLVGIVLFFLFFKEETLIWRPILFAVLVNVVAQISDPVESLFKRAAGVKDSSHLLPGHGGFFDRIDSLILAAPFFYYLLKYIGMR